MGESIFVGRRKKFGEEAQNFFVCKIYIVFPQISLKSPKIFPPAAGTMEGGILRLVKLITFFHLTSRRKILALVAPKKSAGKKFSKIVFC